MSPELLQELRRLIDNVTHSKVQGYEQGNICQVFCARCNLDEFYIRQVWNTTVLEGIKRR